MHNNIDPLRHNSFTYSSHSAFTDFEVLNGQTVLHSFPRHFHDTFGLAVIHSGVELCWNRGAEHVFQAGDVALFNAGEIHDGRPGDINGWTYDMVHFSHDMICRLLEQDECWFDAVCIRDPRVFAQAKQLLQRTNDLDLLKIEELMISLLAQLVYRHRVHKPDPQAACQVRDFINAHVSQPISGKQLAIVSGLSIEHTIRSFRNYFGITPHSYHQARRIETARVLLRGRTATVEIANDLGFYDQSHFTKWFRKILSVTPVAYRSAFR